jgi:hypothetical protein
VDKAASRLHLDKSEGRFAMSKYVEHCEESERVPAVLAVGPEGLWALRPDGTDLPCEPELLEEREEQALHFAA